MRSLFTTLALIATGLIVTACNTMEGAGKDVQVGGQKLENAADRNKGSDSRGY